MPELEAGMIITNMKGIKFLCMDVGKKELIISNLGQIDNDWCYVSNMDLCEEYKPVLIEKFKEFLFNNKLESGSELIEIWRRNETKG